MVSNESLTALDWFLIEAGFPFGGTLKYNDVVRNIYDALFELNVECDFIPSDAPAERLAKYEMIVTPGTGTALRRKQPTVCANSSPAAATCLHHALLRNRRRGDRMARPRAAQPHDVFGMTYNQFTRPNGHYPWNSPERSPKPRQATRSAHRTGHPIRRHRRARQLRPLRVEELRRGDPTWLRQGRRRMDRHPARRRHHPAPSCVKPWNTPASADAGTALAGQVTVRRGTNARGEQVTYLLNYSADEVTIDSPVSGDVVVAPVVVGTDGTVDESATAAIALKEGSKVEVGDRRRSAAGMWSSSPAEPQSGGGASARLGQGMSRVDDGLPFPDEVDVMRSVEPAQLQTFHRGQDLQRGALRIGDAVALAANVYSFSRLIFALFEILVHGMVLAQRLAFQQGVEPDHLRTVGVGLHGSRGNGLQPQIAVVRDAVVKDFAGHALHAKMLGDGDLIGPIGVFEGFPQAVVLWI